VRCAARTTPYAPAARVRKSRMAGRGIRWGVLVCCLLVRLRRRIGRATKPPQAPRASGRVGFDLQSARICPDSMDV
jgi:hypothetical protein